MLTSWALQHNRRKKQLAWTVYQKWILRQARLFHVTSQEEVNALRKLGLNQPAAIVPNGVPLPELLPEEPPPSDEHRALFLSRIHPKKGIPMLIEAWAEVDPDNWVLEIVGPGEEGHREELERQVRQAGLRDVIQFSGSVSDDKKWEVYRSADLFVLPTYSENFGIVVAEALAAGLPVITTTGTPWNDLESHGCGWWVEPALESVVDALACATALDPEERTKMGARGRRLVEEQYSWSGVANKMTAAYRWMLTGEARPNFIQGA
jgi:glycosyltransferase involved in cell wall biosynthesis